MDTAVGLGGGADAEAARVGLARVAQVVVQALAEVVGVDEVVASVVGRVNVDHLDFAVVALLQQLEHLQVVAFDEQVLASVEVDRVGGKFRASVGSNA